jgi:hypothetical protein
LPEAGEPDVRIDDVQINDLRMDRSSNVPPQRLLLLSVLLLFLVVHFVNIKNQQF